MKDVLEWFLLLTGAAIAAIAWAVVLVLGAIEISDQIFERRLSKMNAALNKEDEDGDS